MAVRERIKDMAFSLAKTVVNTLVVIGLVLVLVAIIGDQNQKLYRTIGCELGVPAINGARNPVLLKACWTDEGLAPPAYFNEP